MGTGPIGVHPHPLNISYDFMNLFIKKLFAMQTRSILFN
jgi:hypothetical protein